MILEQKTGAEVTHLALIGKLDLNGVQAIELRFTAATASAGKPTLVDISGLDFVSSLGIRMFLSVYKALRSKGVKMLLFRPTESVANVFSVAGLQVLLSKSSDEQEAVAELLTGP